MSSAKLFIRDHMMFPQDFVEKLEFVAGYIGPTTDNWLVIKRHILNAVKWEYRGLFSKRHPCTKKQVPNDFDRLVMQEWHKLTGVEPKIPQHMVHDEAWTWKPKGWALNGGKQEKQQQQQ